MAGGTAGSYVAAFNIPDNGNPAVLIVGKMVKGKQEVINAFSGEEAIAMLIKLIGKDEANILMAKKGE